MTKYKIGDKFAIEIGSHIAHETGDLYGIKGFNSLVFDNYGLSKLERLPDTKPDSMTAEEAWEIARELACLKVDGGLPIAEICEIFGNDSISTIFRNYTAQEAKAKIDAWRAQKEQIQVGDVVTWGDGCCIGVVTQYATDRIAILRDDGFTYYIVPKYARKTGRRIDIQSVLDQIGGGGDG